MNFMKSLTSLVAKNQRCWAPPGLVPGGDSSRVQVWAPCGAQAQRRSVCVGGSPSTTGFSRNFRADWRGARPLSWDSRLSADPTMAPKGRSEVSRRVACWPERSAQP